VSKPTISFSGMTFEFDGVNDHVILSPGFNVVQFDINQIKNAEIAVEFKWAQPEVFSVGQLVRIEGHLCKVVAVAKDGSVTFEKVEESK
jgi:cytochrome c-type biogenesis protein CcmE